MYIKFKMFSVSDSYFSAGQIVLYLVPLDQELWKISRYTGYM